MSNDTVAGVTVHTPDPSEYHELDDVQSKAIGNRGTVIPRASQGKKTNKIVIDPVNPLTGEGGIVIDLDNLDQETRAEAAKKASVGYSGEDAAIAAFKFMQEAQNGVTPEPEAAEEIVAAPEPQEPVVDAPSTSVEDNSKDDVDLRDIMQQQSQMLSLMSQMVQKTEPPKVDVQAKEEEEPVMQETQTTEVDLEDDAEPTEAMMPKREAVELLNGAFAELKIPGLQPVPAKPKFRVIFNLGDAGTHTAWYHWVGTHNNGLFLIYDTRFEYGMQYTPPNLGPQRSIRVDVPDNDASYSVYSLDFVHPFGVFEIINLVLADVTSPDVSDTPMNEFLSPDYNELDDDLMKQIM